MGKKASDRGKGFERDGLGLLWSERTKKGKKKEEPVVPDVKRGTGRPLESREPKSGKSFYLGEGAKVGDRKLK